MIEETFLSYGPAGAAIVGLVYFILMLRAELKDLRAAHKVELAEKDKLIFQIQEARIAENQVGRDVIKSVISTQEAIAASLRGKTR